MVLKILLLDSWLETDNFESNLNDCTDYSRLASEQEADLGLQRNQR